jgi:transposase
MADMAYWEIYAMTRAQARQRLVTTHQITHSISETARRWHTSRHVVRKWLLRYGQEGEHGLEDRSHRPLHSPHQVPADVEDRVMEAWRNTHWGRKRLALYLLSAGLAVSPHTIRHILRRRRPPQPRTRRRPVYPAFWAWDAEQPFSLLQVDVKDIHDKAALGTGHTTHIRRQHLPRYQYTACDGRTRLRFLAYAHANNSTNGLAFLLLVTLWLRAFGIECPICLQTDWGQEFGGDRPDHVAELSARYFEPLRAQLRRYPMGRKGYNGRVERSHRTDDEEFYAPYLLQMRSASDLLAWSQRWLFVYNTLRPHFGIGMNQQTPLMTLRRLGYTGSNDIALLPPVLLDPISADLVVSCDRQPGNDLLATYTFVRPVSGNPRAGLIRRPSGLV